MLMKSNLNKIHHSSGHAQRPAYGRNIRFRPIAIITSQSDIGFLTSPAHDHDLICHMLEDSTLKILYKEVK